MKPILFSGSMVRAIMDGRKTMTRRVIKPPPEVDEPCIIEHPMALEDDITGITYQTETGETKCADKYQKGDILWVRETWATSGFDFKPDGSGGNNPLPTEPVRRHSFIYRANGTFNSVWNPSIHMPREAARLFLLVMDVRVERVQDITEEDAWREGIDPHCGHESVHEFRQLWDKLNAKRGYSWESNPWVYVISFKRISKEEAQNEGKR